MIGLQLAQTYYEGAIDDFSLWLSSEKHDGIRCCYHGGRLWTRNWNPVNCPDWFLDGFPSGVSLDGELHAGIGNFQFASATARRKDPVKNNDRWKTLRFEAFDLPEHEGCLNKRLDALKPICEDGPAHLGFVPHNSMRNETDMETMFDAVTKQGGEGLMLKRKGSDYSGYRTYDWMKVK